MEARSSIADGQETGGTITGRADDDSGGSATGSLRSLGRRKRRCNGIGTRTAMKVTMAWVGVSLGVGAGLLRLMVD